MEVFFDCRKWYLNEYCSSNHAQKHRVDAFNQETRSCWELMGKDWQWTSLHSALKPMGIGDQGCLFVWMKITYAGHVNTQHCFESFEGGYWDERQTFLILPESEYIMKEKDGWILYRFPFESVYGKEMFLGITASEYNILLMDTYKKDLMK